MIEASANSTISARPAPRRGFSLVELMIVIALMTIVAAVAIPRFQPSIHAQLEAAAQIVAADTAYARNLAVSNNSNYRLSFDLAQNRYVLTHSGSEPALDTLPSSPFRESSDLPTEQSTDLDEIPHIGQRVALVAVQRLSGSPTAVSTLEFDPMGATTRGEPTIIWLVCGTGGERRFVSVTIDPVTGLAEIGQYQASVPAGV